jgi:hypothetical protein
MDSPTVLCIDDRPQVSELRKATRIWCRCRNGRRGEIEIVEDRERPRH